MEIIKVRNADYARYEELLLERDGLRKEAYITHGMYVKEFGELILGVFEKQIACIRKKKQIAYYQKAINRGEAINQIEIDALLAKEMADYQRQLDEKIAENDAAKSMTEISELDVLKIRKIYRKIAKQLHPDINPMTGKMPELMELWNAVQTAYRCNSLEDMEQLELLTASALKRLGLGELEIEVPDIGQKIHDVEEEISRIRSTDPYQYKFLLVDADAVAEKKKDLEEQKQGWTKYEQELDDIMESLLKSGVKIIWAMK